MEAAKRAWMRKKSAPKATSKACTKGPFGPGGRKVFQGGKIETTQVRLIKKEESAGHVHKKRGLKSQKSIQKELPEADYPDSNASSASKKRVAFATDKKRSAEKTVSPDSHEDNRRDSFGVMPPTMDDLVMDDGEDFPSPPPLEEEDEDSEWNNRRESMDFPLPPDDLLNNEEGYGKIFFLET